MSQGFKIAAGILDGSGMAADGTVRSGEFKNGLGYTAAYQELWILVE